MEQPKLSGRPGGHGKNRNEHKEPIIRVARCVIWRNPYVGRKALPGGGLFVYKTRPGTKRSKPQTKDIKKMDKKEKPKLTRRQKWLFAILIILFVIMIIALASDGDTPSQSQKEIQQNQIDMSQLTEDEQIEMLVSNELKGNNNMKTAYVRKIDVVEQTNGGLGVFVEYNADDNLTTNLSKGGIESKMSEIYTALYTSGKDIRTASVTAYFPLLDSYGNKKDGVVYKSVLNKTEADKVNWNADKSLLKVTILPSVWTTTALHREFR
ncbi:MAG: hypothetical protein P9L90_05285 [Candidatus Aadella gelida]|nr:hypothetical protein [Candidatus Aadella gelida]